MRDIRSAVTELIRYARKTGVEDEVRQALAAHEDRDRYAMSVLTQIDEDPRMDISFALASADYVMRG